MSRPGGMQTLSVSLPSGFRLRPALDEDAAAVAAFANDETEAFTGARVVSAQWLLRNWTASSVNREQDIAVVEAPTGHLCACLSIQADPPYTRVFALGMVAPPYHGRGLGAALVAENERRARRFLALANPGLRVVIHSGALADEPRVSALLAAHDYREVRRTTLMRIDFEGEPAPPAALAGINVRPLRPDDAEELFAVHREAFADLRRRSPAVVHEDDTASVKPVTPRRSTQAVGLRYRPCVTARSNGFRVTVGVSPFHGVRP
jgi:GNAT superfamily N-acetyltransferase